MSKQKKYNPTAGETRRMQKQQILFASIAVIIILAMVISAVRFP